MRDAAVFPYEWVTRKQVARCARTWSEPRARPARGVCARRAATLRGDRAKLRAVKFAPRRRRGPALPALPASCRAFRVRGVDPASSRRAAARRTTSPATDGGAGGADRRAGGLAASADGALDAVAGDDRRARPADSPTCRTARPSPTTRTERPHYPQWAAASTPRPSRRGTCALARHGAVAVYVCRHGPGLRTGGPSARSSTRRVDPICAAPVLTAWCSRPTHARRPRRGRRLGLHLPRRLVDAPSLRSFIDAHYGQGPEQVCADGIRF